MGMFDYIHYKGQQYQTKDTPSQLLDNYELRDDGTLWYEEYEAEWDENASRFGGHLIRHNVRWEHCNEFTGILKFYRSVGKDEWEEFEATFSDGKLINILEI